MSVVPSASIDGCTARRIANSRSPSSRSVVRSALPPSDTMIDCAAADSTSAPGPSNCTMSREPPGSGICR